MPKSCLLLVNPRARSGVEARDLAISTLKAVGFDIEQPSVGSVEEAHKAIRQTQADMVVLGGGDGTMTEAAGALLDAGKVLGILPLGTANDLAGSLGIPKRLDAAVQVIADGHVQHIDMGFVNDRPFFNAVTLGLGVDVVRLHQGPMKKRLGVFNYPRVIVQGMRRRRYLSVHLKTETRELSAKLLHIGIANGRYHGGGLPAHQDATIDDGILHLYAVRQATPLRYLRTLPALLLGREGGDDLLRLEGTKITLKTEQPWPFSADGEEIGHTPIALRCEQAALPVLVPKTGVAG